jgi:hypothetical protein
MNRRARGVAQKLGLPAALVLWMAPRAAAGLFTFDPDGAAPTNPASLIGAMDWSPGNSLAVNSVPPAVGNTFQQHQHASLSALINSSGNPFTPAGLNSVFEITVTASSTQVYTAVSATSFSHRLAPVQSTNSFFEIWFDTTPDANPLAGTGYNDGTRIFLGTPNAVAPSAGGYTYVQGAAGGPVIETFDQFGANDYPAKTSVVGAGGITFDGTVNSFNATFFIDPVISLAFNTSLVTPFEETNPSALFAALAGGVAPAVVPNNTANGLQPTDFQFQADANNTFTIPEPTLSTLTGFGIALTFACRRTRR